MASSSHTSDTSDSDQNESPKKDKSSRDTEYKITGSRRAAKKSKTITVEMDRDIMNSSLTMALDRTKTSNASAMEIFGAVAKSMKYEGKALDLNELVLSERSVSRKRNLNEALNKSSVCILSRY